MERWIRARDIGLTILIWIGIVFLAAWTISHFITALLILVLSAMFAYAISPGVTLLQRWRIVRWRMPRWLAALIVYLVALGILGGLIFFLASTAIAQLVAFAQDLPTLLKPGTPDHPSAIARLLSPLGITDAQINEARQAIITQVEQSAGQIAGSAIPVITGIATGIINLVLVFILSVYLVMDGPRVVAWFRTSTPIRYRTRLIAYLEILSSKVGGYIRGQLILSTLIGALVGGGMAAFGIPYALLLGILAFLLEFVPILGVIISGAACVLIALATKGFLIALGVLGYFVVVHILEGDILGPRIVGHTVGLHPVLAILALAAGTELFGIWGAVFSVPVAGVLQALLVSLWTEWRSIHPEHFSAPPPEDSAEPSLSHTQPTEQPAHTQPVHPEEAYQIARPGPEKGDDEHGLEPTPP